MKLLLNDLSLHGQFSDLSLFKEAVSKMMGMRRCAKQFDCSIQVTKNLAERQVTHDQKMSQVIRVFTQDERRALMQWFSKEGPFWEDQVRHPPGEYWQHQEELVTDCAVGEAAWRNLDSAQKTGSAVVSFNPSDWLSSPLTVDRMGDPNESVEVANYWDKKTLHHALQSAQPPVSSWGELESRCRSKYSQLHFAQDAFTDLSPRPFKGAASERIQFLLGVLNRLAVCFDDAGRRTPEGNQLYQQYFTGQAGDGGRGALFTDSSASEKVKYKNQLTFKHPVQQNQRIFCPWHGKVQTSQFRIHFSYPIQKGKPVYIVYVGRKLTI